MPSPTRKADWPIIAGVILALVVVALGVYVWGYFALCDVVDPNTPYQPYVRFFKSTWLAKVYFPANCVEYFIRQRLTAHPNGQP